MKIVNIDLTFQDYPDPYNWAVIIYMSGCSNQCPGCQNIKLKDYDIAESDDSLIECNTADELNEIVSKQKTKHFTRNIVFSGGDPLFFKNRPIISEFCEKYGNKYDICIYTGHSIEQVKEWGIKGFKFIKCGRFDQNNARKSGKTETTLTLASPNQNFYDGDYNQISKEGILTF